MSSSAKTLINSKRTNDEATSSQNCRPSCPVCGGELMEIKHKRICSRCRTICETCCEGGRG